MPLGIHVLGKTLYENQFLAQFLWLPMSYKLLGHIPVAVKLFSKYTFCELGHEVFYNLKHHLW